MFVRNAMRAIVTIAAVGALVAGGAGTAAAATGSGDDSSSASTTGSSDGSASAVSEGGPGSSASIASSQMENAWQRFVDAGVQVAVDTGSLGVWDTGSVGLDHNAPGIQASFDDKGRLNMTLTKPGGAGALTTCSPALVDLRYAPGLAGLLDNPADILNGLPGVTLFVPQNVGLTRYRTAGAVDPGVYALAGLCVPQGNTDIAVELMVVPDTGVGSVEQVVGFGSDAGSLGLEQLLDPGSSGSASSGSGAGSGSGL